MQACCLAKRFRPGTPVPELAQLVRCKRSVKRHAKCKSCYLTDEDRCASLSHRFLIGGCLVSAQIGAVLYCFQTYSEQVTCCRTLAQKFLQVRLIVKKAEQTLSLSEPQAHARTFSPCRRLLQASSRHLSGPQSCSARAPQMFMRRSEMLNAQTAQTAGAAQARRYCGLFVYAQLSLIQACTGADCAALCRSSSSHRSCK